MIIRVPRSMYQRVFGFRVVSTRIFMIIMIGYDFCIAGSDHKKS